MPLFLTRKDREIIAEQEKLDEVQRQIDEAQERERKNRGARAQTRQVIHQLVKERMRPKEEEWNRIRAEIDPPLRDLPAKRPPFKSNDRSICGAERGYCKCGHGCDIKRRKCYHIYNFGEIECLSCGEKLGA